MTQLGVPEFQGALARIADNAAAVSKALVHRAIELPTPDAYRYVADGYPDAIAPHVSASGVLSAQWFREITGLAPTPPALPSREQLSRSARWALSRRDPAGAIEGVSTRSVFTSSRRTIADSSTRHRVGWVRYASATACGFCRMLATRALTFDEAGAPGLYRSRRAALASPHRPDVRGHDHCRCIAVPFRDYTPPGYVYDWLEDYQAVSRDADGHLRPEWQIAELMERRAAERAGAIRRRPGRPRKEPPPSAAAGEPLALEGRPLPWWQRWLNGGADPDELDLYLTETTHERAAQIAQAARDRVFDAQRIVARADTYVSTAARVTHGLRVVSDVAAKLGGGAYPVLRDVRAVLAAADEALSATARVTGGSNEALTLVTEAITSTERIAHATKQLVDEGVSLVDEIAAIAAGARALIADAGDAARMSAAGAAEIRSITDLRDHAAETLGTLRGLQARGNALSDIARHTQRRLARYPSLVAELPVHLRQPILDLQRIAEQASAVTDDAWLAMDAAAEFGHAVRDLVNAIAYYWRVGFTDQQVRESAFAYSARVVDELAAITGRLPAETRPVSAVRPPTWVISERVDLPRPAPIRSSLIVDAEIVDETVELLPGARSAGLPPGSRSAELPPGSRSAELPPGSRSAELPPAPAAAAEAERTIDTVEAELHAALEVGDDALVDRLVAELEALEAAQKARTAERAAERSRDAVEAELNAAITAGDDAAVERLIAELEAIDATEATATEATAAEAATAERTRAQIESELFAAAAAGDEEAVERLNAELRALDQPAKRRRRRGFNTAREGDNERIFALIEQGWDPDEAESEVTGVSVEAIRRRNFIAEARSQGYTGQNFEQLLTHVFNDIALEQYLQAEADTKGYMVKSRYKTKIDPLNLWFVNEHTARQWMSDEMAEWFDQHGRITKSALREMILSGHGNWRNPLAEDFLQ